MKEMLVAFALVLALSDCATQNVAGTGSYQLVPDDRVVGALQQPGAGELSGIVIIKRDPGMVGAALSSVLLVDGKPVARIKPGEFFQFRSPLGEHLFGVSWSGNFGAAATSSTREIAVDIKPGKTYYLRMLLQPGSGIVIERASQ